MQVKCIKEFSVNKYDDNGWVIENEYVDIKENSIWEADSDNSRIIGGDIRLQSEDYYNWLEISEETFTGHFVKI